MGLGVEDVLLLWSLPGGTGALLAGKEAGGVARVWEVKWEEACKTPQIKIREMSCYSALAPSIHQDIRKYTHKTRLQYPRKQTHTSGFIHTCIHLKPANTHKTPHSGFLFICWLARWSWALIGPGGDWQGEQSNDEARQTTGQGGQKKKATAPEVERELQWIMWNNLAIGKSGWRGKAHSQWNHYINIVVCKIRLLKTIQWIPLKAIKANTLRVAPYLICFPSVYTIFFSTPPQCVPWDIDAERGREEMEVVLGGDEREVGSEAQTCSKHLCLPPFQQFLHPAKLQVILMAPGIVLNLLGDLAYRSHCP